ncbi:alpha-L-glycero-D-manno-heptose beta-1,4-glucosyltransferase [Candidatus Photodesmus katoptron]|uniref:Lipopolysaccharide biosynthesis glycosyltransferase n=1 Tax=Candidatus Photodesmus katoptron Akat1 TaxID=1236703 RepID=S3EH35_9GAMM|nr:glycosyltransferase family 2 protein [Candidatus Photodesmus katoptron]EPE37493.1 lipopolysaccharide biosynthesis glycosyltransferase [Candidatus Photodesmus katoptron Akat1]KEY90322.1 alpha-L-glycero-D-manno-heptose beta-1,4-glucosyltransferase [Candidatus Photodesmus katoptron]
MFKKQFTLAVALIVKNEERHLKECLETVYKWVDEIVVLDSGSTDNTEEIARRYTKKFFVNKVWLGFGEQRRLAQSYVKSDYIFWLDADERVTLELKRSILKVMFSNKSNTLYRCSRLSWVFGRFIRHCGWHPERILRLYPTKLTQYNNSLVHEKVEVFSNMNIENLPGDIIHYTYKNINHYLLKSASYSKAWAEQRKQLGKKGSLSEGVFHAISCFIRMYIVKVGFLDGKHGFLLSLLSAYSTFLKYAELWIQTSKNHSNYVEKSKL